MGYIEMTAQIAPLLWTMVALVVVSAVAILGSPEATLGARRPLHRAVEMVQVLFGAVLNGIDDVWVTLVQHAYAGVRAFHSFTTRESSAGSGEPEHRVPLRGAAHPV